MVYSITTFQGVPPIQSIPAGRNRLGRSRQTESAKLQIWGQTNKRTHIWVLQTSATSAPGCPTPDPPIGRMLARTKPPKGLSRPWEARREPNTEPNTGVRVGKPT